MEWEAVLVVLVTALAVSRTGDVVNAILGSVLPSGNIGPTSLTVSYTHLTLPTICSV